MGRTCIVLPAEQTPQSVEIFEVTRQEGRAAERQDRRAVLALDFGGTKMALATADVNGAVLHRRDLPTRAERGAEQAVERAIQAGQELLEILRSEGREMVAVGVATMGITMEDRVQMAPNVPGWDRLALPSMLRVAFGSERIQFDNDVKAAAAAELLWGALQGVQVGIYLNLGTGIAAALVVDGQVVHGAHGAAGEIAYNPRYIHEEVGVRHDHAPLEEYAGGRAIAERAVALFGPSCTPGDLFRNVDVNPEARAVVEATLSEIAFHLTNLAIALDPERIVVGGGLMRAKEVVLPRLAMSLQQFVPVPPSLVEAHFSVDAALKGAIALGLNAAGAHLKNQRW